MRISDWSSDVCSSDLQCPRQRHSLLGLRPRGGWGLERIGRIFLALVDCIAFEEGANQWFAVAVGPVNELTHRDHLVEREGYHDEHRKRGDQSQRAPCPEPKRLNDEKIHDAHVTRDIWEKS